MDKDNIMDKEIEKLIQAGGEFFTQKNRNEFVGMFLRRGQAFMEMMTYYRCALMEMETKFNVMNEEFSLQFDREPISNIKTRLKSPQSIVDKLLRKDFPIDVSSVEDNLNDIAGIRVICSFLDDVYMLEEALLKHDDVTLIEKRDYIASPKKNGYRSLHLIVSTPIFLAHEKRMMKVEVQLRTIAMDFWASLEHQINYKKKNGIPQGNLSELYECAEMSAELDRRMAELRKKCGIARDGEKEAFHYEKISLHND